MRDFVLALSLLTLGACSREPPPEATHATVAATASASSVPSAAPVAKRCLPVVAASCGCVNTCGGGIEVAPGKWRVTHPAWGTTPVMATVAPWCVDGACTDAFHGEIVCGVICPRKPADPTCHFQGDACVSGRDAAP